MTKKLKPLSDKAVISADIDASANRIVTGEMVNDALRNLAGPGLYAASGTTQLIDRNIRIIDEFLEVRDDVLSFNKYHVFREMTRIDSKVDAALVQIANVVEKSYDKPMAVNSQKHNKELEKMLEDVEDILGSFDFEQWLGETAYNLNRDGDVVHKIIWNTKSSSNLDTIIEEMVPIPMQITTCVDREYRPGKLAADSYDMKDNPTARYIIKHKDFYYTNERYGVAGHDEYVGSYNDKILAKDAWHISMLQRGNWTDDIMRRLTYGVWGISPLESLRLPIKWRYLLQRVDMRAMWMNLPKVDHSIDVQSLMDLNLYTGTIEERITKANAAIKTVIDNYKTGLTTTDLTGTKMMMEPESAYIHTDNVKIKNVGGQSHYRDIIPIVRDIDQSVSCRLGIPLSMLGYESGATYAIGYITRTYMNSYGVGVLNAIEAATKNLIKTVLEKKGRHYPRKFYNYFYLNYIVDDFESEKANIYSQIALYRSGLQKMGETRERLGLPSTGDLNIDNQFVPQDIGNGTGKGNGGEPANKVNLRYDQTIDDVHQQLNDPESDFNKILQYRQNVETK